MTQCSCKPLRHVRSLIAAFIVAHLSCAAIAGERFLNIDFSSEGTSGSYFHLNTESVSNPVVDGGTILMDWADVETERGVLNFAPADAAAAAWSNAGKKFVIIIRYLNEAPHGCGKPQHLPRWVIARVPTFCDRTFGNVIPDYFDPAFKADLKAYVQAVAAHFAKSPYRKNILYARIGLGLGSEGFYLTPCRPRQQCDFENSKSQLVAWGFTPAAWEAWQKDMLEAFQTSFSYTKIIYPLVRLDTNEETGEPVQKGVALWAGDKGVGVGALGLSARFADGPAQIRTIMGLVREKNPSAIIQLQAVRPVRDADELASDIEVARGLGADAVEWYSVDLANPAYANMLRH